MHDQAKPEADAAALARELEEMRRELLAERTRFADFASIASDWWWEMSADLRLTYVSERFSRLFNRKVEEVLGKPRRDMALADPDDPKWIEHKALLAARKPFRNFETTLVDGAGIARRIVTSGLPIFDAAGAYAGYRGVGIDVTDIRRHEEEVAGRTRVLEATLENLEEGVGLIDKDLRAIAFNRRPASARR